MPVQEDFSRKLQGVWKYNLLLLEVVLEGKLKPSQLSVQAVTPAEGPWLNHAQTAKTASESEHPVRVSTLLLTLPLGEGRGRLFV